MEQDIMSETPKLTLNNNYNSHVAIANCYWSSFVCISQYECSAITLWIDVALAIGGMWTGLHEMLLWLTAYLLLEKRYAWQWLCQQLRAQLSASDLSFAFHMVHWKMVSLLDKTCHFQCSSKMVNTDSFVSYTQWLLSSIQNIPAQL